MVIPLYLSSLGSQKLSIELYHLYVFSVGWYVKRLHSKHFTEETREYIKQLWSLANIHSDTIDLAGCSQLTFIVF